MPSILSDRQTIADLRRERDQHEIGFRLAKAQTVEWEVKKLEEQLIGQALAREAWAERVTQDRAPWPVLAKALARRCVRKDPRHVSVLLRDAIHEALKNLAQGLTAKA